MYRSILIHFAFVQGGASQQVPLLLIPAGGRPCLIHVNAIVLVMITSMMICPIYDVTISAVIFYGRAEK